MKAAYPFSYKSYKRTKPPIIYYAHLRGKRKKYYEVSGIKMDPESFARWILTIENHAIVFFGDIRSEIGPALVYLVGETEISGAGDELKSLKLNHGKQVTLGSACAFFADPTPEKIESLAMVLFDRRVRLAATPGGTAIRFAKHYIPRSMWQPGDLVRDFGRAALTGGAVHWRTGVYDGYNFDLRSAYAWAMSRAGFPISFRFYSDLPREGCDGFILSGVFNYKTDLPYSPLAIRAEDGSTYHPTIARNVSLCINDTDLQTLSKYGKLEIVRVDTCLQWKAEPEYFKGVMQEFFGIATRFPSMTEPIKTIRNALYGKTAEGDTLKALQVIPYEFGLGQKSNVVEIVESDEKLFAIVSTEKTTPAPHHNPVYASIVTAAIRSKLYESIDGNEVMIDTDGFISTRDRRADLDFGPEPGQWTFEGEGKAVIAGPRIYAFGDDVTLAGQHLEIDPQTIREVIRSPVTVLEHITPHPLKMERVRVGKRTIKAIKYPYVTAEGSNVYVTRSPTICLGYELPPAL